MFARFVAILGLAAMWVPALAAARPGDLDSTFGDQGQTVVPINSVTDLRLDGKARVLVAGTVFDARPDSGPRVPPHPRTNTFVARFEPDGSLDPTFGAGGLAAIDSDSEHTSFGQLAVQPDGSVLVAVVSSFLVAGELVSALTVTHLDDAGHVDPSFAESAGRLVVAPDDGSFGTPDLFVLADGAFTVATLECTSKECRLAMVRATANGTLLGGARTPDGLANVVGARFVLAKNDGLLLGGVLFDTDDGYPLVLARFTAFGEPDSRYPRTGRTETSLSLRLHLPVLALDAADRPIALGRREKEIETRRFQPTGDPDPLFASTLIAPAGSSESKPSSIALQPDGRVVVAGASGDFPLGERWLLAMLGPNGGLDASFGHDGIVTGPGNGFSHALAIQPDGRILIAGDDDGTTVLARFEGTRRECGDATGDGALTVTDGVQVLRAAAGLVSSCLANFCDTNANGVVTVTDGVRALRAAAGLATELRCAS